MALDILHDNWGPYTHTEVENALKAYLAVLENRINQAIQSGGVGLADLSAEVQALLNKANTALQPDNIAAWAKAQNKPGYTVSEITGVEGFQNLLAKLQDMDQKIQAAGQSGGVDPDDEMSSTSEKPVQNKVIKAYVDGLIQGLQNVLNTITQDGATQGVIDTFNEVKAFLEGINNQETLAAKLVQLQTQINSKANDNAVVKSISVNNVAQTKDSNGNVNINVQGQDGKSAYQVAVDNGFIGSQAEWLASLNGNDGVENGDDVVVVNNYNGVPSDIQQGQVAVLGAALGMSIGKVFNVNTQDQNNATPYRLWIGTQQQLEALNEDYEDNTIYLVGIIPTVSQRFNVSFNGGDHTSIPASTPQTAKEGSAFSVVVSPASGYTIDSATGTMAGGGTLTKTENQDGTVTFSTTSVTGAISIQAAATKHITGITISAGTRSGNSIPLTAVVAPSGAENVTLAWSVNDTTNFGISGSGTSATLTVNSGASNASVTISCQDTNASSGTASGTLQLTGITYVNIVPITALGSVTYAAGQATNTYQFSVEVTPSGGNTPAIEWSVVPIPSGTATISATGLLTITEDCSVVVTATAGQYSASSSAISLTYAVDPNTPIQFADSAVKQLLLNAGYGSGGEITYNQAAASVGNQTTQQAIFKDNTSITSFDEWQYFTNSQFNVSGCTSLTSVTLPIISGLVNFDSRFGLGGSHGITGVIVIPEGYTTWGSSSGSFQATPVAGSGITGIHFPSTMKTISIPINGENNKLPNITEIDLSNTIVDSICQYGFKELNNLVTIKLPDTLATLPNNMIRNCYKVNRIEFGTGFTTANWFMQGNPTSNVNMTYVFRATTPPTWSNLSGYTNRTVTSILVPRSAVEDYKTAWPTRAEIISAIEDEVTS